MDFFNDLLRDLVAGAAYGAVGLVLMLVGYLLLDRLTPGHLGTVLCEERRRDAGIIVGAALLGIGIIVTVAILAAGGDLTHGLAEAAGFGAVGVLLMAVAFVGVDRVLPGSLGEILTDEHEDPAVAYVTAAALLGVSGIIAAAIS